VTQANETVTMVQMSVMTTTITEANMLQRETKPLRNVQEEETKTRDEDPLPVSKQEIIWKNVIMITVLHILAVIGIITSINSIKYQTAIWGEFCLGIIK
jgi:hypothetical protein